MPTDNEAVILNAQAFPLAAGSLPYSRLTSRALLCDCGSATKTIRFRKGRDVIVAGSRPQFLYVNHDGWLLRYKILHDGRRQIVNFVLPGEVFGLQACVFSHSLYSVATITEAVLSTIPIEVIGRMVEHNAGLSKALLCSAVWEAAILGEHLIDTARRTAYGRVSHFLLELFVRLKQGGHTDDTSFAMPLTQEVIGDALGLSPVHVNRTLRALRDDKLIVLDGKRLTLLDFAALCRVSDFEASYLGGNVGPRRRVMSASAGAGFAAPVAAAPVV
jgi:CRP-like cAMP-binding protein